MKITNQNMSRKTIKDTDMEPGFWYQVNSPDYKYNGCIIYRGFNVTYTVFLISGTGGTYNIDYYKSEFNVTPIEMVEMIVKDR